MAEDLNKNEEVQEFEAKLPGGAALRGKGPNILETGLVVALLAFMGYTWWEHKNDTKDNGHQLTGALKEMVLEQKVMTQAIRESNCLQTLPPEQRQRDSEFCKRVSR